MECGAMSYSLDWTVRSGGSEGAGKTLGESLGMRSGESFSRLDGKVASKLSLGGPESIPRGEKTEP